MTTYAIRLIFRIKHALVDYIILILVNLWPLILVFDMTSPQSLPIPYRQDIFAIFFAIDMEHGIKYHIFQITFTLYAITPIR